MEMAVTKCKWADFVVYSERKDEASFFLLSASISMLIFGSYVVLLKSFFLHFVVLELITWLLKRNVSLLP